MITRPSATMLVVLVLLAAVGQASGFIVAKRRYHGPSSGTRQPNRAAQAGDGIDSEARLVPSQDHLTLSREAPYSFKRFGARKLPLWGAVNPALPARSDRGDDAAETVVQPRPGMETQLGGWSYARTVLTNRGKAKDGAGGQGAASGSSSAGSTSGAAQSAGSSGDGGRGSSDGVTGGDGSGGAGDPEGKGDGGDKKGQGGDDDDDDDEDDEDKGKENKEGRDDGLDSWELSEFGDSQDGLGISFSSEERESAGAGAGVAVGSAVTAESGEGLEGGAPQEYEVVCDGDVCERKPIGGSSAQLAQTVAGASADVDAADAALAAADAADAAALGDGAGPEGQEGGAAATDVDGGGDDVDSSYGAEDAGDAEDAPTAAAVATAGAVGGSGAGGAGGAGLPEGGGEGDGDDDAPSPADNPDVAQLVSMGWELEESAAALAQSGGDLTKAAEALAAQEEADLERYEEGLADLQQRGWDSDVAMSAMREAGGNSTAALLALEEEDKMLSVQFEQSIEEMVEHGWDEEVARKALLMQWQKDIEGGGGSRKAQKQFEKTVKGVHEKGVKEGKAASSSGGGGSSSNTKKNEPPAPTPAKREDVVFEVTDKTLQKVVLESPVPVILDVYAEWCGPCKQLTPALEEAAIRSGGMFRVAKVDAEKQKGIAEVLGIKAFPSVFGVKDGIILDNFVGGLPQDEMQAFMMGVVMGIPPPKDKELREHQKGQSELRGISRKLAHVAGLAVLGSRKKESLCIKVDKALSAMLPTNDGSLPASEDAAAVAAAKKAARTVITVLMSAYKFPEDPKYRSLSTTSKVYEEVLAPHPPMLEALRLAGFRHKDGDESHLTLLHRNMAVLASVQDRVEVWNKSVKMPEVIDEDSEDEYDSDEEDEEQIERLRQARAHLAKVAKLEITDSSGNHETAVKMEMGADCTVGELFQVLQEDEGFGEDLVLTTAFPKRELAASDPACRSSTLRSLGLTPSARLTATTAAALAAAAEKEADGDEAEAAATRKAGLKAKMMDKSRDGSRKGSKKAGSLFGASDGIIEVKKGKHQEYFGGDSTVTLAAEDTEEDAEDEGRADASAGEDDFGQSGEGYVSTYSEEGPSSSSDERGRRAPELAASAAAAAAAASRERGGDDTRFVQQFEDSDAESESERGTSATEVPASEDPSSDGEYSMESSGDGDGYDAAGSAEEGRVSYDVESGEEYDDEDEDEDEEEGSVSYDDSYSGEQEEEEEEEEEVGRPMSGGKQVRGRQRGAEGEGGSSYDEDESYDDDVDSYYDESFSSEEQEARGSSRGSLGRPRV